MDASSSMIDSPVVVDTLQADAAALGSQANPATSCVALRTAGKPTGLYYLKDPATNAAFEGYCDQDRSGGGWALVFRSVISTGSTTEFWNIPYAQRLDGKGAAMAGANYYAPTLYRVGTEYMDTVTDLQGVTAIAIVATATGFDTSTMKFTDPALSVGNQTVFNNQFASGWSANDYDGDVSVDNCATEFSNVTQHYGDCWAYNLGADADMPYLDGGVGPHMHSPTLTALLLSNDGTGYSRVNELARYARW